MDTLTGSNIILRPVKLSDGPFLYTLYNNEQVAAAFEASVNMHDSTPESIVSHVLANSYYAYVIQLSSDANMPIGECALHNWQAAEKFIEIGGSLWPTYWGRCIMSQAFELMLAAARSDLKIEKLIAKTAVHNAQAIRMAQKMGFSIASEAENITTLVKAL